MRPEDDPLEAFDPFIGALRAVGPEVVGTVVGDDGEVDSVLVLVDNVRRDAVSEVDLTAGEVEVLGILKVGKDVALEAEPVAVVLGIPLAALGQISRLGNLVLSTAKSASALQNSGSNTHSLLRQIGIERNLPRGDVHVPLE